MVTITNYRQRQKEDGTTFYVLEVQGGIEMIRSKSTGNFYATAKKAYVPSTFDEQTCIALTGTEMQGSIIKEECEPYEYIVKETGEEIIMHHRWAYVPEDVKEPVVENTSLQVEILQPNVEQFSQNGTLKHAS
ncbi:conserved hypothetical protein [Tenacibaculum maritimum]|uniref:hypothetical protein n=1 Tax=Tenacibaculum maritimum TaxID=107401 RepID=UPI0012E5004B|nr:hypothetical protein [Tenacibaculum maritimum]CAA0190242.1 conserved hypothetical protein [Tenacibaculum maritimum]